MSDLISRQAVFDALIEKGQNSKRYKFGENWELNLPEIIEAINVIPSAKSERNKGEWIDEKPNMYTRKVYCSECGCMALSKVKSEGDVYNPRYNIEFANSNFCPNCGADMREDIPIEYFENGGI